MVNPQVRILASVVSHMPLFSVWQHSGITQRHGFVLKVDACDIPTEDGKIISRRHRVEPLFDGSYDYLSGLHHETYALRARGDKRLVYLAQAQNDWDDRVVVTQDIRSARDLEGQRFIVASAAPCILGNVKHALQVDGVDLTRVEFIKAEAERPGSSAAALQALVRGEAAGASVDVPFDLRGEKLGLRRLEVSSVPVIHNATMCANREWVLDHEETTLAFLRSMVDAIHFFKAHKSSTCAILEEHCAPLIGLEGADEIEHLQATWSALLSPKPYPHPLAVWNVYNLEVAHHPEMNFIGPFETWDTSYLRTIDDSGYIDELYGGTEAAANPAVNPVI